MKNYEDGCPECFSSNIAIHQPIKTENGLEYEMICRDCGEEWVEID